MSITITEALAEIKTITKRIASKQEFMKQYLARQDGVRDPLEKQGGSFAAITAERQSVTDLGALIISYRRAIQQANDATSLTLNGVTRTISEWLIWRRDVAPTQQHFLGQLRASIQAVRSQALKTGVGLVVPGGIPTSPQDIIVNIDELALAKEIEDIESALGALDGQLSLLNATTMIAA